MTKIGQMLDNAWNWLVTSSANSAAISLTVKGFLAVTIASVLGVTGAVHLQIPDLSTNLNGVADAIVLFITYVLGIVGSISTVVGFIRKIWISTKSMFPTNSVSPTPTP